MVRIYTENDLIEVTETYKEIQNSVTSHAWIEVTERIWIDGSRFKMERTTIQVSKIVRFKD
jgi:ribosomal protein L18E